MSAPTCGRNNKFDSHYRNANGRTAEALGSNFRVGASHQLCARLAE